MYLLKVFTIIRKVMNANFTCFVMCISNIILFILNIVL